MTSNFLRKILISILALLYFFGGLLQHQGLLTQTQTNYLVLFLIALFCFSAYGFNFVEQKFLFLVPLFLLGASFLAYDFMSVAVYFYYYLCFLFSLFLGYRLSLLYGSNQGNIFYRNAMIKKVFAFFWLQVFLSGLQNLFLDSWIAAAKINIGDEDAISGSLYIQSDATLGCLAGVFVVYLYGIKESKKNIMHAVFLYIVLITSCNSFANKWLAFLLSGYIVMSGDRVLGFYVQKIVSVLIFIIFLWLVIFGSYGEIHEGYNEFFDKLYADYYSVSFGGVGSRWVPLGFLLYGDVGLWGLGPLTYYNPATKEWLFNSGLSLNYSLFFDYGLFGLIVFYYLIIIFMINLTPRKDIFFMLLSILLVFSQFNFSLTDISFWIPFGFVLGSFRRQFSG